MHSNAESISRIRPLPHPSPKWGKGQGWGLHPANQYASPYVGMGNNPANRIDPDGREDELAPIRRQMMWEWVTFEEEKLRRQASLDNMIWGFGCFSAFQARLEFDIKTWLKTHYNCDGSPTSNKARHAIEELLKTGKNFAQVLSLRINKINLESFGSKNLNGAKGSTKPEFYEDGKVMLYCDIYISDQYFRGSESDFEGFSFTLAHELAHVFDYQNNWDELGEIHKSVRTVVMEYRITIAFSRATVLSYLSYNEGQDYEVWYRKTMKEWNNLYNSMANWVQEQRDKWDRINNLPTISLILP